MFRRRQPRGLSHSCRTAGDTSGGIDDASSPEGEPASGFLNQIDFVSGVSGGALSAAYFVTNRDELLAHSRAQQWEAYLDRMMLNYRQRQWYLRGLLNPLSWGRTLFTDFNRGNLASIK